MILDNNLVFSNAVASNFTTSTGSTAIDLSGGTLFQFGNATTFGEDLGIGDGEAIPRILVLTGTAMTTATSAALNIQFQGSTDSTNWSTYIETGIIPAAQVATANNPIAKFAWPHRQVNAKLPRYVRLNYDMSSSTGTFSTGSLSAYVVLQRDDWPMGLYPAGFSVGS